MYQVTTNEGCAYGRDRSRNFHLIDAGLALFDSEEIWALGLLLGWYCFAIVCASIALAVRRRRSYSIVLQAPITMDCEDKG